MPSNDMDMNRRSFLQWSLSLAALPSLAQPEPDPALPQTREALLDEIERRACCFFYEQADPTTGLVRDRARMSGRDNRRIASIAGTGFGLSAHCIADRRGYLPAGAARERVATTLQYLASRATHEQGFYYHFMDVSTGQRLWRSEISSVDTAWLLCGVLHCRSHFEDPEVQQLSGEILGRVNWPWMLNGGDTLSHGWRPESGFLPYRWDTYSELMAMYLLAIGSSSYPIPATTWQSWQRPQRTYEGLTYIDAQTPLFVHQYSHAWFDFRNRRDKFADYYENSRVATQAHRLFCQQLTPQYSWYGPEMWGITASDSRRGYTVWGAPGARTKPDGTLVPCAAGGSVPFLPNDCVAVLEGMLAQYGKKVWGQYGFVDAFHPKEDWYDTDVIAIDQGIMLLMAENQRTQAVWKAIMATPEAERGFQLAGLSRT